MTGGESAVYENDRFLADELGCEFFEVTAHAGAKTVTQSVAR